jgi:hypothetical protein
VILNRQSPDDHDPIRAMIEVAERVLRGDPAATIDDVNAALAEHNTAYNRAPQHDLGGLSPRQVHALISDDWRGTGVVRLNAQLQPRQVAEARTPHNVRVLLDAIEERGRVRATAKGNLPRAFVREMLERFRSSPGTGPDFYATGRLNEEDYWPLHLARVLAGLAGLIKRRKGEYTLTARGRELRAEARAGELYALLFVTHFRELNLAYLSPFGPEAPGFQHTIAYSLYQFRRRGDRWKTPEEYAPVLLLPPVQEELEALGGMNRWTTAAVHHRLLAPLEGFGLAEVRQVPGKGLRFTPQQYRRASRFDGFIRFRLP